MLKPYLNAMTGSAMVAIQCPHCGEDVELEDGASGLFECPYCKNEFEFEGKIITISLRPEKVVITLLSLSIIFAIGAGLIYIDDGNDESWEDSIDLGIAKFCLTISGLLLVVSTVAYVIQQIRLRIDV